MSICLKRLLWLQLEGLGGSSTKQKIVAELQERTDDSDLD